MTAAFPPFPITCFDTVLISGQLDADEFVQLVMAKSKSPNDEMREAWSYFDVDGDGAVYVHLTGAVCVQWCSQIVIL